MTEMPNKHTQETRTGVLPPNPIPEEGKCHSRHPRRLYKQRAYTAAECLEMWAMGEIGGVLMSRPRGERQGASDTPRIVLHVERFLELNNHTSRRWAIKWRHLGTMPDDARRGPGETMTRWLLRTGSAAFAGDPGDTYEFVRQELEEWLADNPIYTQPKWECE